MLYKNTILEMEQAELLTLVTTHTLKLDDPDFLDPDEIIELLEDKDGRMFDSPEDDVLNTIYYGNWNGGAKQMLNNCITPDSLVDYINDFRYDKNEEGYEFFDLSSAVAITDVYHMQKALS